MAHRVATDEICVKRGMGKSPSSRRRELVRVPACCLLAPKDLGMLVVAVIFLICVFSNPALGKVFYIGRLRIDAEVKRIFYAVYAIIMVGLFVFSFFVKKK